MKDHFDIGWRDALREHRERRGLSRRELSIRAGVSVATVKAIEIGSRHPSESTLGAIIDALGLTREEANPLRLGAGHSIDWYGLLYERYPSNVEKLPEEIEKCPWPVYITNQATDVVFANRAFERVWDVDLSQEYTSAGERNLMAGASDPRWAERIENFDELVTYLIGLIKGDPRWQQSPANPAPWLQTHFSRFFEGDPHMITRIMGLWNSAEPLPHQARHVYRVVWRYRDERTLRFIGSTTIADLWSELSWNEWVPADGDTWQALAEIASENGSA